MEATSAAPAKATPGVPGLAVFYGSITVDGAPAPDGLNVVVEINGANCGSGSAKSGGYELIAASAREAGRCGKPGDTVVFRLFPTPAGAGQEFEQRGAWQPISQRVDLTIKTR